MCIGLEPSSKVKFEGHSRSPYNPIFYKLNPKMAVGKG